MIPKRPIRKIANWTILYDQLRTLYRSYNLDRKVAILDNHTNKKEIICRKLGVVCASDIGRIEKDLKSRNI
jgi:hypothetical protein